VSQIHDSNEIIAEYISQILEDGDLNELLVAIGDIAKDTGLGRESLYKSFHEGASPRFDTIVKVLNSFGIRLQAVS